MDLIYHTLVTEFIQNKTKFTVFLEQHNWLWVYVLAQIGQVQVGKGKGYMVKGRQASSKSGTAALGGMAITAIVYRGIDHMQCLTGDAEPLSHESCSYHTTTSTPTVHDDLMCSVTW